MTALALAAHIAIAAGSCTSPLALDTPRVDSVLTRAMKLRWLGVEVYGGTDLFDTMAVGPWLHHVDTLWLSTSPDGASATVSLFAQLRPDTVVTGAPVALRLLDLGLVDVPVGRSVALTGYPSAGETGVRADVSVMIGGESVYRITNRLSRNYTATAELSYAASPIKTLNGVITILLTIDDTYRLRIRTMIEAEE